MLKRILALALCVVFAAFLLAGCASEDEGFAAGEKVIGGYDYAGFLEYKGEMFAYGFCYPRSWRPTLEKLDLGERTTQDFMVTKYNILGSVELVFFVAVEQAGAKGNAAMTEPSALREFARGAEAQYGEMEFWEFIDEPALRQYGDANYFVCTVAYKTVGLDEQLVAFSAVAATDGENYHFYYQCSANHWNEQTEDLIAQVLTSAQYDNL